MKTIFKYHLPHGFNEILMPKGAKILTAHHQGTEVYGWAEVDTLAEPETRTFLVYGTGHRLAEDEERSYIGTTFGTDGLVWHVYEKL